MRIAITLPDEIFEDANALAARLGISRSRLYAAAVEEYVARHRDEDVTARLNKVYGEQDSGMDPALRRAQGHSVRPTTWWSDDATSRDGPFARSLPPQPSGFPTGTIPRGA